MHNQNTEFQFKKINNACCIGAGNIGRAWALKFVLADLDVKLFDINESVLVGAMNSIRQSLEDIAEYQNIDIAAVLSKIVTTTSLSCALDNCDYIQESVPESLDIKLSIYADIESKLQQTQDEDEQCILASSTSEIPPSQLFKNLKLRAQCLVAHPLNPPHLIPIVELCPSPWTSVSCLNRSQEFFKSINQEPIVLNQEISGFVANRLQLAVLAEAFNMVNQGVCSPADIDTAMTAGLARRWLFVGPFETGHLNSSTGFKDYVSSYQQCHKNIVDDLNISYQNWTAESIEKIAASFSDKTNVSEQQVLRDKKLMQLNQFLIARKD